MPNLSLSELEVFDPKHKKSRYCCPLCGNSKSIESKHRSLWVDKNTGGWFCHRCDSKGLLLEWQTKPSYIYPSNKDNFNYSPQPKVIDENKLKQVKQEYQSFAKTFPYSPGQQYLSSRGIDVSLAKASGCGFGYWKHWTENDGKYTCFKDRRVCFPVINQSNEIVAISARAIDDDYLDPKQVVKGYKSLGVFATVGALEDDVLIIAEAPIDALSLAMAGFPALATIGTSWPSWLVSLASKKSLTLVAFDNDEPGNKASDKLIAELSNAGANASRLVPSKKDWNEVLLTKGLSNLKSEVDYFISTSCLPIAEPTNTNLTDFYRLTY